MSKNIIANLEEMQVYLRNNIQEILICKHKESEALYLINTFFKTNIFENINLDKLEKDLIGIEYIEQTDEDVRIFTRYYFHSTIKDFVNGVEKVPLERQVTYSSYILDKLLHFKNLPLAVLDSLFNDSHIVVDEKNKLQMLGSIIINPDYRSITVQDIFRRIGNLLHIIFSGKEVVDKEINNSIPPDIKKIITNCFNNQYFKYEELVSDYKGSSVYKLMNPESEEGQKIYNIRKNLRTKRRFHSFKKNGLKIGIILIILLPFIVYAGGKLIDFNHGEPKDSTDIPVTTEENSKTTGNEENETDNIDTTNTNMSSDEGEKDELIEQKDELYKFYNDKLMQIGKNENIGIIDDSKYYSGTYSIRINNSQINSSTLVGVIDLNSEEFNYLKNRKDIDISMWIKSNQNEDMVVTLKLIGKSNKILTQSNEVHTPSQNWSLQSIGLNTTSGNYIKIYITPKSQGDIWIDSIEAEILK